MLSCGSRSPETEARNPLLLILALSFSPYIWKSSVSTIDYLWSLTAILLALRDAGKDRPVAAGVWAGIATGFRPSNVFVTIPLLFLLRSQKSGNRSKFLFCLTTMISALTSLSPLFFRYGLSGWFDEAVSQTGVVDFSFVERFLFFGYRSATFIGLPALLVGLLFLLRNWRSVRKIAWSDDHLMTTATVGVVRVPCSLPGVSPGARIPSPNPTLCAPSPRSHFPSEMDPDHHHMPFEFIIHQPGCGSTWGDDGNTRGKCSRWSNGGGLGEKGGRR